VGTPDAGPGTPDAAPDEPDAAPGNPNHGIGGGAGCGSVVGEHHDAPSGAPALLALGLPYLRTSVDHGTAFALAGRAAADAEPLRAVIATTLALLRGALPRRGSSPTTPPAR
jgi:hypothetical protein